MSQTFSIVFANHFSIDDFKSIFAELGNVKEIKVQDAMFGRIQGYTYTIHMESLTKKGEYFQNELLETKKIRYCYEDNGSRPSYFICVP